MLKRMRELVAGGAGGALAIILVCAALAFGVRWLFTWTTEQALIRYAERSSAGWAEYLQTEVTELKDLLEGRPPDARQRVAIYFASALGDALRFRLYRTDGQPAIDSDPDAVGDATLPAATASAWRAVQDGRTYVRLRRPEPSVGAPDGPRVLADVALPLFDVDGARIGSAHLVLDMSDTFESVGAILLRTGAGLTALVAVVFLAPALGWLVIRGRAREAEDAARRLVGQDALTGLVNRRGFIDEADRLRARARDEGTRLLLICLDVDRFRSFNDQHGRPAGDALLRRVGDALRRSVRAEDLLARIGPDDFAVLIPMADPDASQSLLDRLAERTEASLPHRDRHVVGVRLGGHVFDPDGDDIDLALRRAEIALGEARVDALSLALMFEPQMEARARRRSLVERIIQEGMAHDRFSLAFQPLVDRASGRIQGFEALMRLRSADGAPVSPAEFIPVAEEIGVITRLGAWAIDRAAAAAAAWPEPLTVSVNLSVQQFRDGRLVDIVRAALSRTGLPPERFELEVTESLLISDLEGVSRQLAELKALGVSIAMDDFGTGYSSLSYLWRFGFDRLKLDRSFVQALGVDQNRARDVIGAIVALGHRLGMSVTAEGIETEEEERLLAGLGCDVFQGYRFGKPLSEPELRDLMAWTADAQAEASEAAREDEAGRAAG